MMDGMFGQSPFSTAESASSLLGILYAEDFDELPPGPAEQAEPHIEIEPAAPRVITEADLERAGLAAVAQARIRWEQETEQTRQALLARVAEQIADTREAAAREAAAVAEGVATTMLSMLAAALPAFCREHAQSEVRALVQHLLPPLQTEAQVVIRVHSSLIDALEQDLQHADLDGTKAVSVVSAPIEPGDLRVSWETGSFRRDTKALMAAVRDALSQLGLLSPIDITPERRMELAE